MACNFLRLVLLLIALLGHDRVAYAQNAAGIFAPRPFIVGMSRLVYYRAESPPEFRFDRGDDLISRTVVEVLPNYILRGLEQGLNRRVTVVPNFNPDSFTTQDGQSVDAVVSPTVTVVPGLGVRILTRVAVRGSSSGREIEESLLIPRKADFGELDSKMMEHGLATARRLAILNSESASRKGGVISGLAQFFCVIPDNPDDRRLVLLARRLTLELPFYLTQASRKRKLDVLVRGLEFRESLATCDPGFVGGKPSPFQSTRQAGVEDYAWDGTLAMDKADVRKAQLTIRASDRLSLGNFRRVTQLTIDDLSEVRVPELADRIIGELVKMYQSASDR
jgi:hypothetical protein